MPTLCYCILIVEGDPEVIQAFIDTSTERNTYTYTMMSTLYAPDKQTFYMDKLSFHKMMPLPNECEIEIDTVSVWGAELRWVEEKELDEEGKRIRQDRAVFQMECRNGNVPLPIVKHCGINFPDLCFTIAWYSEGSGCYGRMIVEGGNVIEDECLGYGEQDEYGFMGYLKKHKIEWYG